MVFLAHRMRQSADTHFDNAVLNRIYRRVLFARNVNRARNEFFHKLFTADNVNAALFNKSDNVSATVADKKTLFHLGILLYAISKRCSSAERTDAVSYAEFPAYIIADPRNRTFFILCRRRRAVKYQWFSE